jgi:hypothetical protein
MFLIRVTFYNDYICMGIRERYPAARIAQLMMCSVASLHLLQPLPACMLSPPLLPLLYSWAGI